MTLEEFRAKWGTEGARLLEMAVFQALNEDGMTMRRNTLVDDVIGPILDDLKRVVRGTG